MQRIADRFVLSPTDLVKHLACAHITTLDRLVEDGRLDKPLAPNEPLSFLTDLGINHERRYLEKLRSEDRSIVEIKTAFDEDGRRQAEAHTLAAMRSGADVIYQAAFYDGLWGGQADFLLRSDRPSELGNWSYEIADTKLARTLKVAALIQMATYAQRLSQLQGVEPQSLYVITGDDVLHPWRHLDVAAYARRARARLEQAIQVGEQTQPVPVAHCKQCRWEQQCEAHWAEVDDLCLVASIRSDQRSSLVQAGIKTLAQLAGAEPEEVPRTIGRSTAKRLIGQAREQLRERSTGKASYAYLPFSPGLGLERLPEPDQGDLYLDFEGDPFAEDGEGREYLAGLGDRSGMLCRLWAHDKDEERVLTDDLIEFITRRWQQYPDMHVYHYASYETTALKRLTARHGVAEEKLDRLLRGQRFVDLYLVVRQSMIVSKPSQSLKMMEGLYWGHIRAQGSGVADAMASVVAYEKWLSSHADHLLSEIQNYNDEDVRSTAALHSWLQERKSEIARLPNLGLNILANAGTAPTASDGSASTANSTNEQSQRLGTSSEAELYELGLAERLRDADQTLMSGLVQWHRREARVAWQEVFRLGTLDDDDLIDDPTALGGLGDASEVGSTKRSKLYEYTFPAQQTKLHVGSCAWDVQTHKQVGMVTELDAAKGRVVVKRTSQAPPLRGLGPPGPIDDFVQRAAIHSTAEAMLEGRFTLGQALLQRHVPSGMEIRKGETSSDAVLRVGQTLGCNILAVQGPPGSGKTRVGAKLIQVLLDQGKTVGVVATSHAVVGNLLREVDRPGIQKCDPNQHCKSPLIEQTTDNAVVASSLNERRHHLVGGTSWLWARPDMAGSVDVLVIDEAGQFSLANAMAVTQAAGSLVLLGDPQQLTQPTQAIHPFSSGVSVLEHFLQDHDTIQPDKGIFLDTSWRMHPKIAKFVSDLVYEGRLKSAPKCEVQEVTSSSGLFGNGLYLIPSHHAGMSEECQTEASTVTQIWHQLQGSTYRDRDDKVRLLSASDVLILAPYNKQVRLITQMLPHDARVGTVDKFQGQEAPVVIYSMTSSTAQDAPRGIDFLYDLNRLNVALSRAQAIAAVVLSPLLLDAGADRPSQLRLVNALCLFAESAQWLTATPRSTDLGKLAR